MPLLVLNLCWAEGPDVYCTIKLCFKHSSCCRLLCSARHRADRGTSRLSDCHTMINCALQMDATLAGRKKTTLLMMPSMVDMLPNG